MDSELNGLIDAYAAGADVLPASIAGLAPEDFGKFPVAGTWSIGQIVLHMLDSDLICADRMKRVIAEENPTLIGFDESAFSRNLFYEKQDPFVAAELVRNNRRLMVVILRSLPAEAFERVGTHNERGRMTLRTLLETYTKHLLHHVEFIKRKRGMIGKSL